MTKNRAQTQIILTNSVVVTKGAQQKRSILIAIPIASPSLELHRLVIDNFIELGDAGGTNLWWRPISSPTLADPIYKCLRSPELIRKDQNDERKYRRYCHRAGSEENYVRGEYFKLSRQYEIPDSHRPTIVLSPKPYGGVVVKLPLAPAAFETALRRRTLSCFLYHELSESRMKQFLNGGVFDQGSMNDMQRHADSMANLVIGSIARDRGIPQRYWDSYLMQSGLKKRPDPSINTTATASMHKGSLVLRTESFGKVDGKVVFSPQSGRQTLQMHLMWRLLLKWPQGLLLKEMIRELYKDKFEAALVDHDKMSLMYLAKLFRALVRDIRNKKLEPAGINPDILPTIPKDMSRNNSMMLQFVTLTCRGLGRSPPPEISD